MCFSKAIHLHTLQTPVEIRKQSCSFPLLGLTCWRHEDSAKPPWQQPMTPIPTNGASHDFGCLEAHQDFFAPKSYPKKKRKYSHPGCSKKGVSSILLPYAEPERLRCLWALGTPKVPLAPSCSVLGESTFNRG